MMNCKKCNKIINKHTKSQLCNRCCQLGKKLSDQHKRKIGLALKGKRLGYLHQYHCSLSKRGNKNPMWKGDGVQYIALHAWVRRRLTKPILCPLCKKRKAYDLANISGKYKRDLNDWEWLCRHCHMIKDGRLEKLAEISKLHYYQKGHPFYPLKGCAVYRNTKS